MTRLLAITLLLGACNTPPLALTLAVSGAASDSCGATTCSDVALTCESVASIRILDPNDPLEPYIHMCVDVVPDHSPGVYDLCSLARIDLDPIPLPEQTLEVQVVVFPRADVVDQATGDLVCPADVRFDSIDGFPTGPLSVQNANDSSTTHWVRPAIGGRAFYHPGDSQVVVELGCPDLGALNDPTCSGSNTVAITATVLDFDNQQPLPKQIARLLTVSVGEPVPEGSEFSLTETERLESTVLEPIPAWAGNVDLMFTEAACLEVLEDGPEVTSTLTCLTGPAIAKPSIDIPGFRLATPSLMQILTALGTQDLSKGLVVGVVLDNLANPAPGFTVVPRNAAGQPNGATIKYMAADHMSFGGNKTTTKGIFISDDAPFNTTFTTAGTQQPMQISSFGGLVDGKITISVLQFSQPDVGGS